MTKTKEEKAQYCKEWREKNRERYREMKRACYRKNIEENRAKARKYYEEVKKPLRVADRSKYKEIDRLWAQKRRVKFRALFLELKMAMGNKCTTCGYDKHPQILHFHHLGNKYRNVSELTSFKKIKLEAAKCILLCPNCHMELTFVKK